MSVAVGIIANLGNRINSNLKVNWAQKEKKMNLHLSNVQYMILILGKDPRSSEMVSVPVAITNTLHILLPSVLTC